MVNIKDVGQRLLGSDIDYSVNNQVVMLVI
jgi:hypothetical protein